MSLFLAEVYGKRVPRLLKKKDKNGKGKITEKIDSPKNGASLNSTIKLKVAINLWVSCSVNRNAIAVSPSPIPKGSLCYCSYHSAGADTSTQEGNFTQTSTSETP